MKDFENVTNYENIYRAYKKAKAGKGFKGSSARFEISSLNGVLMLKEQLKSKTYTINKYSEFMVYEPKERLIKACAFKDKVVQHVLCDSVLIPKLSKQFISHNYAGQIGKGTLYGLNCLSRDMQSFYKEHGIKGWILKCDVSKFFYSIEHEKLKDIIDYYFGDEDIIWLNNLLIDSTVNPGLPLGNQTSQVYALLFMDGLDHFITGELGIKYYGRYMDDFYLIHQDRNYIKQCLADIKEFITTLGLTLNGKTQIMPFKNGINFTGFHTYITPSGKTIRKLKNQNKRNAVRKYRKMAKLVKAGTLDQKELDKSYTAWKSHISHGNCVMLGQNTDRMIEEVLSKQAIWQQP